MSQKRRDKRNKKRSNEAKNIISATETVQAMQKMIDAGAIKFNFKEYKVHLLQELFWDGKDTLFKRIFSKNLQVYMDMMTGVHPEDKDYEYKDVEIFPIKSDHKLAYYHSKERNLEEL